MKLRRRTRRRLEFAGLGLLSVAVLAVVGGVTLSAIEGQEPAPAPSKVAEYYENNKSLAGPADAAPVVAFVGDSFTAGAGSTDPSMRWATKTARGMGWKEVNLGLGGTGYASSATKVACGLDYCETYPERVDDVVAAKPDIVVVAGGLNDQYREPGEIDGAVAGFYDDLRAKLPDVKIVAISPVWRDGNPPAIIADIRASVEASAARNKATFLDIKQPLADQQQVLASDGAHPNDAGHGLIADATITALTGAGLGK